MISGIGCWARLGCLGEGWRPGAAPGAVGLWAWG